MDIQCKKAEKRGNRIEGGKRRGRKERIWRDKEKTVEVGGGRKRWKAEEVKGRCQSHTKFCRGVTLNVDNILVGVGVTPRQVVVHVIIIYDPLGKFTAIRIEIDRFGL